MCVSSREGFSISARSTFSSADASSAGMDSEAAVRASSMRGFSSGAMSAGLGWRFSEAGGDPSRADCGGNFKLRNFRAQCAANYDGIQKRVQHPAVTKYAAAFHQRKFLVLHSQTARDDHREIPQADRGRKQDFLRGAVVRLGGFGNHRKKRGKDFLGILHDLLRKLVPVSATERRRDQIREQGNRPGLVPGARHCGHGTASDLERTPLVAHPSAVPACARRLACRIASVGHGTRAGNQHNTRGRTHRRFERNFVIRDNLRQRVGKFLGEKYKQSADYISPAGARKTRTNTGYAVLVQACTLEGFASRLSQRTKRRIESATQCVGRAATPFADDISSGI